MPLLEQKKSFQGKDQQAQAKLPGEDGDPVEDYKSDGASSD